MHRIVDAMVDHYRPEVEKLEDRLDDARGGRVRAAAATTWCATSSALKRDITSLRRVVLPQRDVVGRLARREFPFITDEMAYRFRDVYDHLVRLSDEALIFQDRVTSILDAHLSNVSNRLNEQMKVLTLVTTIAMPFTVLGGPVRHERAPARHLRATAIRARSGGSSRARWRFVRRDARGPPAAQRRSDGPHPSACRRSSPTRSRPARSSSAPPRSSRSSSRTRSTRARARIAVTIEFGGKRLVRVEDDGEGMTAEDARLAIERHATSKIRRAEDLAAIATLGFRGEALPSIASVSRFTLRTRARGEATRHRDPGPRRRRSPR